MPAELQIFGLDFRTPSNLAALSGYLLEISDVKEPFRVSALDDGSAKVEIHDTSFLSGKRN